MSRLLYRAELRTDSESNIIFAALRDITKMGDDRLAGHTLFALALVLATPFLPKN